MNDSTIQEPKPSVSLLGLGQAWTRVGYGVMALSVVACILLWVVRPAYVAPTGTPVVPEGYKILSHDKDSAFLLRASPIGALSIFLLIFSGLGSLIWTLVDIVDRRKRFVWLLPMVTCIFTFGLHAIPVALYIFIGRETPPDPKVVH